MTTDDATSSATRPRTTGPKILTFAGVTALLAAIGVAVLGVVTFVGLMPLGVLTADGRPGPDALGSTSAPGSVDVDLEAGTPYAIWLLVPSGSYAMLDTLPTVHGPSGSDVRVSTLAEVSSNTARGGTTARTVGGFRALETGSHTLVVPDASIPGSTVLVTEDQRLGSFMAGIFGTLLGAFAAVLLAVAGLGMTIGGGIWWHLRRRSGTSPPVR